MHGLIFFETVRGPLSNLHAFKNRKSMMNFWWVRDTTSQCVLLALYPSRGTIGTTPRNEKRGQGFAGSGLDKTYSHGTGDTQSDCAGSHGLSKLTWHQSYFLTRPLKSPQRKLTKQTNKTDDFEIAHKTCSILVWGSVPLKSSMLISLLYETLCSTFVG